MPPSRHRAHGDDGFTLVELLVVISMLGIVISTLSLAFVAVLATTPDTEARVDDARSTRGLATWLAHDTTSAPPFLPPRDEGGIDLSHDADRCRLDHGDNIVQLTWREVGFTTTTWVASYRYVTDGDSARIVRSTCSSRDQWGERAASVELTAGLDPDHPPVVIANYDDGEVVSVDLLLTSVSGAKALIETGSRNPVEYYP
ncbi:MAG TPA: type II secretion system protein [Ilumatobacter sp.]